MEMKNLKIVFFGTPDFAVVSLRRILDEGWQVAAVVTAPDRPAGRGKLLRASAVKQFALSRSIPVLQPEKLRDEQFVSRLRGIGADLFVVIAFRMLPEVVWTMPRLGTFNLHASLLPRYRGAAPINWAIINGDTLTGVTTFFLSHQIDTGDIILRRSTPILPSDDAASLHDRLADLGASLVADTLDAIASGSVKAVSQSDIAGEQPSPAPKIFKDTCHIDFSRPAAEIHNLVRGLSPYPAAWASLYSDGVDHGAMKIFATAVTDAPSTTAPGTLGISPDRRHLFVDTATTRLEILSLQAPGKNRLSAADFLRGCRLSDLSLR